MLLYNADIEEGERIYLQDADEREERESGDDNRRSFFELRQRALVGLDQFPAFRIVSFGLLRKLRTNHRGPVIYPELEDALGRYFRLLDGDMQRFATLHETLRDAASKFDGSGATAPPATGASGPVGVAQTLLHDGMREIAVVLLACGEMQRKALDLKMSAQRAVSASDSDLEKPVASFVRFAEFLAEALAVSDQLRRKHEELQQLRMRAMASVVDARLQGNQASGSD
jgi:hypothetical protein